MILRLISYFYTSVKKIDLIKRKIDQNSFFGFKLAFRRDEF